MQEVQRVLLAVHQQINSWRRAVEAGSFRAGCCGRRRICSARTVRARSACGRFSRFDRSNIGRQFRQRQSVVGNAGRLLGGGIRRQEVDHTLEGVLAGSH